MDRVYGICHLIAETQSGKGKGYNLWPRWD